MRVDDMYSFNNIYASTPFECMNQHFAKMVHERRQMSTRNFQSHNRGI